MLYSRHMTWLTHPTSTPTSPSSPCATCAPCPATPPTTPPRGLEAVVAAARADLRALQSGGVDAVMFSNEASLPYLIKVEPVTSACMAAVIAELRPEIDRPYGVNVLWDAKGIN